MSDCFRSRNSAARTRWPKEWVRTESDTVAYPSDEAVAAVDGCIPIGAATPLTTRAFLPVSAQRTMDPGRSARPRRPRYVRDCGVSVADRKQILKFDVTLHSSATWLSRQMGESVFPLLETAPPYLPPDHDQRFAKGIVVHDDLSDSHSRSIATTAT